MKSKKGLLRLLALCTAVVMVMMFTMAGCKSQQRPEGENNPAAPGGAGQANEYDTEKVRVLEEAINEIDGVDNVYVVLSPDKAWVALELDDNVAATPNPMETEESTGRGPDGSGVGTPGTTPGAGTDTLNNGANVPAENMTPPVTNNTDTGLTGENGAELNGNDNVVNNGTAVMVPDSLRTEITNLVKAEAPEIQTVYVTADETLVRNIFDIRGVLHSGEKAINDVMDDLEDIGDRTLNAVGVR
ncbi:MAG: hypothetical protein VB085_01770 [Peptococcaceae bacterium]|nr:hypothetical protein [Peptococcaceae bacterium]